MIRTIVISRCVVLGLAACGSSGGSGRSDAESAADSATSGAGETTSDVAGADPTTSDAASGDTSSAGPTVAPGAIGAPCTEDDDCTFSGATCFRPVTQSNPFSPGLSITVEYEGGFCSLDCSGEDDPLEEDPERLSCGDDANCTVHPIPCGPNCNSNLTFCTPPCETDADCRVDEGYSCAQPFSGLLGYCVPTIILES